MLHILLTILRILGIILASIIGLLLFIIIVVVFVPVRYRVKASYKDKANVNAHVSWLLGIVRVIYTLDDSSEMRIRIFGISLSGNKSKKERPQKRKKQNKDLSDTIPKETTSKETTSKDTTSKDTSSTSQDIIELVEDDVPEEPVKVEDVTTKSSKFSGRMSGIKGRFSSLKEMLTDEDNKAFVIFALAELKELLMHIKPRVLRLYVRFGTDDPGLTGMLTGYVAIAKAMFNLDATYIPVFDEKVLELDMYAKGRIRAFNLLRIALKVYTNKTFKKYMKKN